MIKKIDSKILIFIILIIPINQILWNYLLKIKFFQPVSLLSNDLIQPTLIVNLILILIFSIFIFKWGGLELKDFFINKRKIIQGLKWTLAIWIFIQVFAIIYSIVTQGDFEILSVTNDKVGKLLGQYFGNAAFEELMYRGLFLTQFYLIFKQKKSNRTAIVLSIIVSQFIFSIIHIPNKLLIKQSDNLLLELTTIFIVGVIFALIYIKTKNLILLVGVHSLINVPFILNEINFPISLIVLFLIILIIVFWNKLKQNDENDFWKSIMIKEEEAQNANTKYRSQ